ncbi:MAG: hypothetical protein M1274_01450 [Actinobacteria bacterium]|nr:hypothetical protein [Actinomycetota bacterium]
MLIPAWEMAGANERITLFSGQLEFEREGQRCSGTGTVRLDWLPSPRVTFTLESAESACDLGLGQLTLPTAARSFSATAFNRSIQAPPLRCKYLGQVGQEVDRAPQPVASVIVHLCNFSNYLGAPVSTQTGGWVAGRLSLSDDEWDIDIDPVPDLQKIQGAVKASGGYAMTHVCRVARRDRAEFLPPGPLDQLLRFLSFARGAWSGLFLPVGLDRQGARAWDGWVCQKTRSYVDLSNWFPVHDAQPFARTYEKFSGLWPDPDARRTLSLGIAWYVHAVSSGELEARIIHAIAGLELLAYFVLVHWSDGPACAGGTFDNLESEKRIRRLLGACGIPATLPFQLSECNALIRGPHGWKHRDGPEVISWVRNSVSHPVPKLALTSGIMHEAHQLALQYIELAILRLLEYRGPFSNRVRWLAGDVWQGQYDQVPWAV